MVGLILQIVTVMIGLTVTYLLSKRHYEKWGWLIGFFGIFIWAWEEAYFHQWFYFALNPIYLVIYFKGWINHRE